MTKAASTSTTLAQRFLDHQRFANQLPNDEATLIPLYQMFRAMSAAGMYIFNMPRAQAGSPDLIEAEIERVDSLACAIAERLRSLPSVKPFWRQLLTEVLLSHDFFTGGSMADVLSTIAHINSLPADDDRKH
jgi:hypothetical protein